jgi:hypothetical protein
MKRKTRTHRSTRQATNRKAAVRRRARWKKDLAVLKRYAGKKSLKQITRLMGLTKYAIQKKAYSEGISLRVED